MSEQYGGGIQDKGAPLSAEEKRLVERLFSEPLEFPTIFRNWLKNFIETSGIVLPKSAINTGVGGGGGSLSELPAGIILPSGGSTIPSGSLPCNGAAVSRTEYAQLFAAIGTVWGAGDGSTTFNVPDLRDRALYGTGSKVALGATDGGALGTRGPRHTHTIGGVGDHNHSGSISGGGHEHSYQASSYVAIPIQNAADSNANTSGPSGSTTSGGGGHSHGVSIGNAGAHGHTVSGGGVVDTPAFAGVTYVITT